MFLHEFSNDSNKLRRLKIIKEETENKPKKKNTIVYHTVSELYNELVETYFNQYYYLSHAKEKKISQI